jgi:hypothetical protein
MIVKSARVRVKSLDAIGTVFLVGTIAPWAVVEMPRVSEYETRPLVTTSFDDLEVLPCS